MKLKIKWCLWFLRNSSEGGRARGSAGGGEGRVRGKAGGGEGWDRGSWMTRGSGG